jgi:hypothetical protein
VKSVPCHGDLIGCEARYWNKEAESGVLISLFLSTLGSPKPTSCDGTKREQRRLCDQVDLAAMSLEPWPASFAGSPTACCDSLMTVFLSNEHIFGTTSHIMGVFRLCYRDRSEQICVPYINRQGVMPQFSNPRSCLPLKPAVLGPEALRTSPVYCRAYIRADLLLPDEDPVGFVGLSTIIGRRREARQLLRRYLRRMSALLSFYLQAAAFVGLSLLSADLIRQGNSRGGVSAASLCMRGWVSSPTILAEHG